MKFIKVFLLVLGLLSFTKPMHDVPISIFKIYELNDELLLEVTFDIEDISKTLEVTSSNITADMIQEYIKTHTSFEFDSNIHDIHFDKNLQLNGDHIKIKGVFKNVSKVSKTMTIKNTCLLTIDNHSNIMRIELNDTYRDFRMNKKRTEININY